MEGEPIVKILLIGFKLDHGRTSECSVNLKLGFEKLGHEVIHVSPEEILHGMDYHQVNRHRAWKEPLSIRDIKLGILPVDDVDFIFIVQNYLHFDKEEDFCYPIAYFHNEDYCGPSILNADVNFICQPYYKEFWKTFYPWSYANAPIHLSPPAVHPELWTPEEKIYKGLSYLTDNAVEENLEKRDWIWNEHYKHKEFFHDKTHLYDHYWGGEQGSRSPYEKRTKFTLPFDKFKEILQKCERIAFIPVDHVPYSRRLFEAAACNTKLRIYCHYRDLEYYKALYGDVPVDEYEEDIGCTTVVGEYYTIDIDKGRDWVMANHTYEHRCKDIIEKVQQHVSKQKKLAASTAAEHGN